jgi:2-C-methyl-D-erythritol 4-phosphate cytidylyltransferase
MFNDIWNIKEKYNIDKLICVTEGGETRQESVKNGLNECAKDTDIIAVHDGARPFADAALIDRTINDCKEYGASMAGVKVKDTIKETKEGFIFNTPNRENIYIAQTPQVFFFDELKIAFKNAEEHGLNFTDDCQLMESMGKKIYISQGDYKNIKITTIEDIKIAKAFMEE